MSRSEPQIPLKLHDDSVLYGKRVAIDGRLGSMSRRDFGNLVDSKGGTLVELSDSQLDLIVVGAEWTSPGHSANRCSTNRLSLIHI